MQNLPAKTSFRAIATLTPAPSARSKPIEQVFAKLKTWLELARLAKLIHAPRHLRFEGNSDW